MVGRSSSEGPAESISLGPIALNRQWNLSKMEPVKVRNQLKPEIFYSAGIFYEELQLYKLETI